MQFNLIRSGVSVYTEAKAVEDINRAIDGDNHHDVITALRSPEAELQVSVHDYAAPLYHVELRSMKSEKQADLDHAELCGGVKGDDDMTSHVLHCCFCFSLLCYLQCVLVLIILKLPYMYVH